MAESNLDFIKYKELESKIFGIKIGQVIIKDLDTIENLEDSYWWEEYNLIDLRISYENSKYIKDIYMGIFPDLIYVSLICTYEMNDNTISKHKNIRLSSLGAIDLEECKSIAMESFVDIEDSINRFNMDWHFDEEQIKKYYTQWVENCFKRVSADKVFIYEEDSIIKGFIALQPNNEGYNVQLVAVGREFRGQGIYKEMLKSCNTTIPGKLTTRSYLGNIGVEKAWIGMGGHIKGIEHVFHLWR